MVVKSKCDLSRGTKHFADALQIRYPDLAPKEIEVLGTALLGKIGDSIAAGHQIGTIRKTPDGRVEFQVWHIGPLEDEDRLERGANL